MLSSVRFSSLEHVYVLRARDETHSRSFSPQSVELVMKSSFFFFFFVFLKK